MNPRFPRLGLTLTLLPTLAGCGATPNSTAGCNERAPIEVPFDMLPDPPEGVDWSLAEMRASIDGVHRGQLHPIDDWHDQAEDVAPELFTSIVLEARLLSEAELIEYEDGPGPNYDCSVQDVILYADVELRTEGGDALGSAERVSLYVGTGGSGTAGSFFVSPNPVMESVLGESAATLPDSLQVDISFHFDPDVPEGSSLRVSGLDDTGSTRPLARGSIEEHEPFGK